MSDLDRFERKHLKADADTNHTAYQEFLKEEAIMKEIVCDFINWLEKERSIYLSIDYGRAGLLSIQNGGVSLEVLVADWLKKFTVSSKD